MTTTGTDDAAASASARMIRLAGGFQVSQALYVVARLDVATVLDDGPRTVPDLAGRVDAHEAVLRRLLWTLSSLGVFATGTGDRVGTTPLGATLSRHHPQSVHDVVRYWTETHYLPFSELLHTARTGEPAAERYLGRPFVDWVADDPERAAVQARATARITAVLRAGVFDGYRLPDGAVVADVGGGDGSVLAALLTGRPERRGIVFDRPAVVPAAHATLARHGVGERVDVIGGDFFVAVPGADVYVLSGVLHDRDDTSAHRILRAVAGGAVPGARLLLVEAVLLPDDEPPRVTTIDLTLTGLVTGRERTRGEWVALLARAGFALDRVVATPGPFSILEGTLNEGRPSTRAHVP